MAKTKKAGTKEAAGKSTSKQSSEDTQIAKARALIKGAGKTGISAEDLGLQLGLVKKNMDASDRTTALKKVRVLARKAAGGAAVKRDGRNAVYIAS